jgi:hypothetical protein
MKTRIYGLLILFALLIGGGLIVFGCSSGGGGGSDDITFTVSRIDPDDNEKDTKGLLLEFTEDVPGLKESDIIITPIGRIKIDKISGGPKSYTLAITVSEYAETIKSKVTVNKPGVTGSADVDIEKKEGPIEFRLDAAVKVGSDNTAKLTITFGRSFTLNVNQISIDNSSDGSAEKGDLKVSSGTEYELTLVNVKEGTIKVGINDSRINQTKKDVTLSKDGGGSSSGNLAESIEIDFEDDYYSELLGKNTTEKFTVEKGYPKVFTVKVTPLDASNKVTWDSLDKDIATVDQNGKVQAGPNSSGKDPATTTIFARSTDGSGIGEQQTIKVISRILPTALTIKTSGAIVSNVTGDNTNDVSIALLLGDDDLILTTSLKDGTPLKLTNDQDISMPSSIPTTYISFTKKGREEKTSMIPPHVPCERFSLIPKAETALDDDPIVLTLKSNSNSAIATATLTITSITYKEVNNVLFEKKNGTALVAFAPGPPPATPFGSESEITIKVTPKNSSDLVPFQSVSASVKSGYGTYVEVLSHNVKGEIKIRRKLASTFGSAEIDVTVKDGKGVSTTKTISVTGGA